MVLQHSALINIKQGFTDPLGPRMRRVPVALDNPATVDWSRLAAKLGPPIRKDFITATQTLIALLSLDHSEFARCCKKIIALIELARRTLTNQGVAVYPFTACPNSFVPFKRAYIGMVHKLQERRNDVPTHLQDRIRVTVLPLSTTFHIDRAGEGLQGTTPFPQGAPRPTVSHPAALATPACEPQCLAQPRVMAPPGPMRPSRRRVIKSTDALVHKEHKPLLTKRESWDLLNPKAQPCMSSEKRAVRHRRSCSSSTPATSSGVHSTGLKPISEGSGTDENETPYRVILRMPKRFGIFCTPKTSMHGVGPSAMRARPPTGIRLSG